MVVVAPMHRVMADEVQRVVHPAHVPLHRKAKPAKVGRTGDAGPRRRLLGHRHDAGRQLVHGGVHLLQELHGLQVFPAAVDVRCPAVLRPRVVQVEHRGDRVDPQPVDVELLQPVQRIGDQEVAHLGPAEVEHIGAPVQLLTAVRVGVLVERGAVEAAQRPGVLREVGGHPVHDHADAGLMQPVHQVAEFVGRAEARRRRVVRRHLIAPRPAERVLRDRHQLNVRKALGDNVFGEFARRAGGSSDRGATTSDAPRRCSSARTPH